MLVYQRVISNWQHFWRRVEPLTSDVELGPAGAGTRFTPRFKSSQGVQGAQGGSVIITPKFSYSFCHHKTLIWKDRPNRLVIPIFLGIFGPWRCWICQVWNSHSGLLDVHPDVSLLGVLQGAIGMPLVGRCWKIGIGGLGQWPGTWSSTITLRCFKIGHEILQCISARAMSL